MSQTKRLHIFRAGTHRDMSGRTTSFTEADVAACAANYDPKIRKAPLVIGHPALEDDAKGQVTRLEADGPNLYAHVDKLDPAFVAEARAGRWISLSPAFLMPSSPYNPKPDAPYLMHVGFLGAAIPALAGLEPFMVAGSADSSGAVVAPALPFAFSGDVMTNPTPAGAPAPADDLARQQEQLAREKAALAAERTAFAAERRKTRAAEDEALVDRLIKEGKPLMGERRAPVLAFMAALDAEGVVAFAGEGAAKETPHAFFRRFVAELPAVVPQGEIAKGAGGAPVMAFAAPQDSSVDPERLKLHQRALAHQKQHGGSYEAAVRAVS